jgi:ABC-type branched-subunit amino acid transport system permease subunit
MSPRKKSGTTFSMITLGMAELVFAMSLMFSEFFGGEAGVSANRVVGEAFMGHQHLDRSGRCITSSLFTPLCLWPCCMP